jgi:hypothetical protein
VRIGGIAWRASTHPLPSFPLRFGRGGRRPRCRVAAATGRARSEGVGEGDAGVGSAADGLLGTSAELVTHSRWRKANLYFLSREHGRVIWSFFKKKLTRFIALTKWLLIVGHGNGIGGCKILKQWYRRKMNFSRGKLRISITFRGTQGILSIIYKTYTTAKQEKQPCSGDVMNI